MCRSKRELIKQLTVFIFSLYFSLLQLWGALQKLISGIHKMVSMTSSLIIQSTRLVSCGWTRMLQAALETVCAVNIKIYQVKWIAMLCLLTMIIGGCVIVSRQVRMMIFVLLIVFFLSFLLLFDKKWLFFCYQKTFFFLPL